MVRFLLIKIGKAIAALSLVTRGTGLVNPIPGPCRGPGRPGQRARSSPPPRPGTVMPCFGGQWNVA